MKSFDAGRPVDVFVGRNFASRHTSYARTKYNAALWHIHKLYTEQVRWYTYTYWQY